MEISFGWIGQEGLEQKDSFYDYIKDDAYRNFTRIQKNIKADNANSIISEIKEKTFETLAKIKNINNVKPVISWYDINPNNILVDKSSKITGFLDAGGARFAAKEWDIAFIKMDLCKNAEEYNQFLKSYCENMEINEELLNLLTVIVEIDDIAFELESKIKLPIAFESNFENLIRELQKEF